MMPSQSPLNELVRIRGRKDIGETGGAHNQKGVEFQRHWSILRMVELEDSDASDYLFLFEAIQDVSILDSVSAPTSISVNQIKKKDRGEWTWNTLTAQIKPPAKPPKSPKHITVADIPLLRSSALGSTVGKLYATLREFSELDAEGSFISNAGCDVPTSEGGSYATSLPRALDALPWDYNTIIRRGLSIAHPDHTAFPDLSRLTLGKTAIPVDEPGTFVTGRVVDFLYAFSPPCQPVGGFS